MRSGYSRAPREQDKTIQNQIHKSAAHDGPNCARSQRESTRSAREFERDEQLKSESGEVTSEHDELIVEHEYNVHTE